MAYTQPIRMVMTKAQRWDKSAQQETTCPLQSPSITGLPNSLPPDQHLHTSAPVACVRTPPPDYNDPPISLRPLHFDNSSKVSILAYEPYPFQGTDTKDNQPVCHMSKPRIPFWRTKKGIALIVLLSNIIVIGIVLGIVFGTRIDRRRHQPPMSDDNDPLGQNSQGSPSPDDPSDNQDNSMSLFSTTTSSSSTSSVSPTTSAHILLFNPNMSDSRKIPLTEIDRTGKGSGATDTNVLPSAYLNSMS